MVFETVSDVRRFAEVQPQITKIEFLTDQQAGAGTRFRETRAMGKREATVELEVTEYAANDRVRIVSDSHGTVWDTLFTVVPAADGSTTLDMMMEARAHKLVPKLINPLLLLMIRKAIASDLDRVKDYCEGNQ